MSSRNGACTGCNIKLTLDGWLWQNPYIVANFAVHCVSILVPIICLAFFQFYNRWRATWTPTGWKRAWDYPAACTTLFIFLALAIVDTVLSERRTVVNYSYIIYYLFLTLFSLLSELLILGLMSTFVKYSIVTEQRRKRFGTAMTVLIVIMAIVIIAVTALRIVRVVISLNNSNTSYYTSSSIFGSNIQNVNNNYANSVVDIVFQGIGFITAVGIAAVFMIKSYAHSGQKKYAVVTSIALVLLASHFAIRLAGDILYLATFAGRLRTRWSVAMVQFLLVAPSVADALMALVLLLQLTIAIIGSRDVSMRASNLAYPQHQPGLFKSSRRNEVQFT